MTLRRALVVPLALGLAACGGGGEPAAPAAPAVPAAAALAAHSAEFERRVYTVTDGVHVAVGYGLANSILIEGDDGTIVVDTMESVEAARDVKAAFDAITSKPVRAVIYTHNHPDHVGGANVFASDGVPVYSHATTTRHLDQLIGVTRAAIYRRSMRMFGNYLSPERALNGGIGPVLRSGHGGGTPGIVRPTHTFADQLDVTIAGVALRLVHAPGETDDQIFVWIPAKRAVLPGDNFYRAFPNLYTIRGTSARDVPGWVRSLDAIRALDPEFLVPSHTRPLSGAAAIRHALTDYRDAIQLVHDQTVRGMNAGLGPDDVVARVKLPPHLAASPYLQEFYGTVAWSVRAIYDGYLGWFDGDAAHLAPLDDAARARRLAVLAGGPDELMEEARRALDGDDPQWAAELADAVARVDPQRSDARTLEADALERLGLAHPSANGRHYYLTQADELRGTVRIDAGSIANVPDDQIRRMPIAILMNAMPVHLASERALDVDRVVGFRFPDVGEAWTVHVRRGVAEVRPVFPDRPDNIVTVDSVVWKEIAAGRRSPAVALASGAIKVEGGTLDVVGFLRLFEPDPE